MGSCSSVGRNKWPIFLLGLRNFGPNFFSPLACGKWRSFESNWAWRKTIGGRTMPPIMCEENGWVGRSMELGKLGKRWAVSRETLLFAIVPQKYVVPRILTLKSDFFHKRKSSWQDACFECGKLMSVAYTFMSASDFSGPYLWDIIMLHVWKVALSSLIIFLFLAGKATPSSSSSSALSFPPYPRSKEGGGGGKKKDLTPSAAAPTPPPQSRGKCRPVTLGERKRHEY